MKRWIWILAFAFLSASLIAASGAVAAQTAPTATPTLNSILATVAAAKTMTAAAPTATPVQRAAGPTGWFDHATIYSVFVRSFHDSNGDGIGDLNGVTDGLDYIQSLGVDTIWLLPVFKSPSVHGYDTIDYYTVNPDYGTNDDLLRLIREVHKRKMHILLDYVVNHTSNMHPYFRDAYGNPNSPYSDYYIWGNAQHTQYSTFFGVQEMPKLNYDSEKVIKFVTDIALYWMDPLKNGDLSAGVDGFRCDVASGPYKSFWQHLRTEMNKLNPKTVLLGELWFQTPQDLRDYLTDGRLDAAFDFPLYIQMTGNWDTDGDGVFSGKGNFSTALGLARNPQNFYPPEARIVRFINNHDTNRLMSDVQGDLTRAKAAAVFLLTYPGPVVLYYGEEIGMKGDKCGAPDYDNCRREPLDWYKALTGSGQASWFKRNNAANDGISVEEEEGNPASLLSMYRKLGALRGLLNGMTLTQLEGKDQEASLYILTGEKDGVSLRVLINFSASPVALSGETIRDLTGKPTCGMVLGEGVDDGQFLPGGYAVRYVSTAAPCPITP